MDIGRARFGGSREAIGRTIELNSAAFTIVGVAEQRFTGITPGSDYDVWVPLVEGKKIDVMQAMRDPLGVGGHDRQDDPAFWWLTIVARLKPGVPLAQAQAMVSGIFRNEMLHGSIAMFHGGARPAERAWASAGADTTWVRERCHSG